MLIAFDTETHLIAPGLLAPPIVCASFAWRDENGDVLSRLVSNHPDEDLEGNIRRMLEGAARGEHVVTTANGAYDWGVVMAAYPDLVPLVFAAARAERFEDVQIREKLLNLSDHGMLEDIELPDGSTRKRRYSLGELVAQHLGFDRSEEKEAKDSWRLNYDKLDGQRAADYPEAARTYALNDATDTLRVHEEQTHVETERGLSLATSAFQAASHIPLHLMSCWGVAVDQEFLADLQGKAEGQLTPEKLPLLYEGGYIRSAKPARPYANQAKKVEELLQGVYDFHAAGFDWSPWRERLEAAGIKFTKPEKETRNKTRVKERILQVAIPAGVELGLTPKAQEARELRGAAPTLPATVLQVDEVATDADQIDRVAHLDEVLSQYQRRQQLDKLVNTYVAAIEGHERIYPRYDPLKETGRTSSYGPGKNARPGALPGMNIQQPPKEIEVIGGDGMVLEFRRAFVPTTGRVLAICDYDALELVCTGQQTHELHQAGVISVPSRHRALINDGVDIHGFFGAQVAASFPRSGDEVALAFAEEVRGLAPELIAEHFSAFKVLDDERMRSFHSRYRTIAKPFTLGRPGGLGPDKLAHAIAPGYGVRMTTEEARDLVDLHLRIFEEMPEFFEWVKFQTDERNLIGDGRGGEREAFWYTSPLGMVRRGCTYCACANGTSMQTRAAEGNKLMLFELGRRCYDPSAGSVLFGCRPIIFLHDEIVMETTPDEELWADQAEELGEVMRTEMAKVCPDVRVSASPILSTVWSKTAREVRDRGILIPWRPEELAD